MSTSQFYPFYYLRQFLDVFLITISWFFAYWFRFHHLSGGQESLDFIFLKWVPLVILITFYFLHKKKLYYLSKGYHILSTLKANFLAMITIVIILYFFSEQKLSRIVLLTHFILSSFLFTLVRIFLRNILHHLHLRGKKMQCALLVGGSKQMENYVNVVKNNHETGIGITAWLDSNGLAEKYQIPSYSSSLSSIKKNNHFDMIVVGYSGENNQKLENFLKKNYNDVIPIKILPDLSYSLIGCHIEDFANIPILDINVPRISFIDKIFKRSFDIIASLIGLLLFFPFMVLISILIKLDSKGPVFYIQKRIGFGGEIFNMWKFRTMTEAKNNEDQTNWSSKNELRKTKLGKLLRNTSFDEIPQLWNVLIGDMSLVGPRPERLHFVQKFREEIPSYMLRHKMKSGITGWAQIKGWRGDTCLQKRIECDLYYIKNWTLWLDIKIIILTFFKGIGHKNAY